VFEAIRLTLLNCGTESRPWLESGLGSRDRLVRKHSWEILTALERSEADREFVAFCNRGGEQLNLEKGVWLLVRTAFPRLDQTSYQAQFDEFAESVRKVCEPEQSTPAALMAVNRVLYRKEHFRSDKANYYDPQNCYLNRVIDRRLGNPLSLCLVYLFVARRLGLPVTGVGMPGHFILRLQSPAFTIYIDAFNGGNFLTHSDCAARLKRCGYGVDAGFLSTTTPRRILMRICSNLHQIYQKSRHFGERDRVQKYLIKLAS
jgi:regulator of sirC expression with transglutaminase-like and TPR domain